MRGVRLREGPVVTCNVLTVFTQDREMRSLLTWRGPFENRGEILAKQWSESQREINGS